MNVSTLRHGLRLILPLLGLLLLCRAPLVAQNAEMTFTTQRNNSAIKDWTADSTIVSINGEILIIRGLMATGRSDYPYQELRIVVNNYTGPGTYAINGSTYFDDLFGSKLIRTTFQHGSMTLKNDEATDKFSGDFSINLMSNPPNLEPFSTRIYNGKFSATPTELKLEAKTKRDTIRASAGDKGKLIKIIAKNEFGTTVKDVDITVLNPVAGGAKALGKTDGKGELLYNFDVDAGTKTDLYVIKFNGSKSKYKNPEEIHKSIDVSSRYWIYKCGGVELLTFDAGEGKEWKKREAPSTVLDATGDRVVIDDILQFDGKMSIDPPTNSVLYDGQLYVRNIPLPGGQVGNLDLNSKPQGQLSLNCNSMLKYALPEICKAKLGGLTFSLEELEIVDLQVEAGLKIKVKVELDGLATGCSKSNDKTKASVAGGIVISPSGIQEWKLEVTNGLFYNPYFCMNDLKVLYDAPKDTWTASAAMQAQGITDPKKVTTLKGGMTIIKGIVDSVGVEFKSGECVPIPNVPFCIFGGKLGFSGLSTGFTTSTASINAGLFFKSDEELIKNRFPWVRRMVGDNAIAEIGIEGKWTYPKKFTAKTTLKLLKFTAISVTKPWQIEATGTTELDLDHGLRLEPNKVKAFHFGADDYFIDASVGTTKFTWGDDLMYEFDFGGATIRLPDVPDDAVDHIGRPFLKMLKAQGVIPASLGTARAYFSMSQHYGVKAEVYCDLSSNPSEVLKRLGRATIKLECSDKTQSKLKFSIDAGGVNLLSFGGLARKSGSELQSVGRELPGPFVAHPLDTFVIQPGLERMNIFIEAQGPTAPVAYLIAPDGTRHNATTPDSKIIIDQDSPGGVRMLTVIGPAPGAWVLGLVNPKTTDSVTVILPTPAPRSFVINATTANRILTVTWNATGLTADEAVAVHLDNVNGNDGRLVGFARGSDGTFSYAFDDTLAECSYKVHAVLSGNGNEPVIANAPGEFATGKTILLPPQNIGVIYTPGGDATVTWIASPDPTVQNYLIYVRGEETYDSLLAIIPAYNTEARVRADTALLHTLSIRSSDHEGLVGCPAIPTSVGPAGVDEPGTGGDVQMNGISIVPNPIIGGARISWMSDQSAVTVVEVRNLLGATVARYDLGRAQQGMNEVHWTTGDVVDGTYLVVVHSGTTARTAKVVVVR